MRLPGAIPTRRSPEWNGDRNISDNQFVIAAYQASQIYGIGINAQNWTLTFGGGQMRDIDDPNLRRNLAVVMTADYEPVGFNAMATPYRQHVREVIPDAVQSAIRSRCGDRNVWREGAQFFVALPPSCALQLDPVQAAQAARLLRAHRELVDELNWHLAAVANYLTNVDGLRRAVPRPRPELRTTLVTGGNGAGALDQMSGLQLPARHGPLTMRLLGLAEGQGS